MKNDPLVAKLYNKMQQEQNEYRAWLLAQPPEEILNHAYEYSSREDILMAFENVSLRPAQLRALLESQAPLADIYKDYRDHDTNALDVMAMCIEDRADINLMESTRQSWHKSNSAIRKRMCRMALQCIGAQTAAARRSRYPQTPTTTML